MPVHLETASANVSAHTVRVNEIEAMAPRQSERFDEVADRIDDVDRPDDVDVQLFRTGHPTPRVDRRSSSR